MDPARSGTCVRRVSGALRVWLEAWLSRQELQAHLVRQALALVVWARLAACPRPRTTLSAFHEQEGKTHADL